MDNAGDTQNGDDNHNQRNSQNQYGSSIKAQELITDCTGGCGEVDGV